MVRPMERSALPVLSASVPGGRGKPLDDSASAPTHVAGKRFKDKSRTGPFPAARPGQSANALPGVVRIIGGQWRRRKLPVAQGPGVPAGLRPTPDRVRETLFNWLGQDLGGWRCVDVCSGTGALGFEAASRGAARVHMIEQHPVLLKQLHGVCKQLDAQAVQIVAGDGMRFLRDMANREPGSVDVIFFDPPFSGFSGETMMMPCAVRQSCWFRVAISILSPDANGGRMSWPPKGGNAGGISGQARRMHICCGCCPKKRFHYEQRLH